MCGHGWLRGKCLKYVKNTAIAKRNRFSFSVKKLGHSEPQWTKAS